MTTKHFNEVAETDAGYGQLFAILLRQRFWLLGVLLGVVSIAAALTLTTKPTYESSMQLLVEANYQSKQNPNSGSPPDSGSQFTDASVEIDNATQLNLMRSSQLIQRAVDLLRPQYPDIETEDIQDALVLTQVVETSGTSKVNTKIFKAVYVDDDPVKTRDVLTAIQKVYQAYNLEQQEIRLSRGLSFITKQLPEVRRRVDKAETALEKFRQDQDLIDPELQGKGVIEALGRVEQEQQANLAELQALKARYASLQQQLARSPQAALIASRLSQSSRFQSLLNEIQKTELALVQERLRFQDNTPAVEQAIEQRQNQIALLNQEVRRVLRGSSAQVNTGEQALTEGQLGELDLKLAAELVDAQTNLRSLSARAQSLDSARQQLQTELRRFPALLAEFSRLQPEVQVNRETLQQLLQARQELGLEIARGGFDWQVVEEPRLGTHVGPNLKQNLLLGAVAGLMLGSLAAFIRDGMDDAVHTSDDLSRQVALPMLGMVPEIALPNLSESGIALPFRRQQSLPASTMQVVQWAAFRESLDLIYKNIQLINSDFPFKSLVVTSALAGEGKSTLTLGLAVSAARLHQRVLVIDADLRRPGLHKQLGLSNERGLSTLLTSEAGKGIQGAVQTLTPHNNIDVLTAGPAPIDPAKLLSSHRMVELMARFEQTYDVILLDTPPVLGIVDAILTASFCSGVVLVGRIGRVTRTELNQAINTLSKFNVIGVIANGATPSKNYPIYEGVAN